MHEFCSHHMIVVSVFPSPPLGSPSSLEEPTSHMAVPKPQVSSLLRGSPTGGQPHMWESSSLPLWQLVTCTVPLAKRIGRMLHLD